MFKRILKLPKNYSFFLFGPRGVGKTTLLKEHFDPKNSYYIDLLDFELETRLLNNPKEFSQILEALPSSIKWIIIDEIQKIPPLLNEVHRQIENNKNRFFALTGSSARKIKHGNANLLAGRAFNYNLHSLTIKESNNSFNLQEALSFGTLPKIFEFKTPEEKDLYLRSYTETYLKEEIQQEGLIRNLPAFRKFLPIAALDNGQILSYANIAREVGVDAKTIKSYYEILEDTLIGFTLPAYAKTLRKKQRTSPKFYLFDTGIKRSLAGELTLKLQKKTDDYGRAFEHFMITEIIRMNDYLKKDYTFSYFATENSEIDLVIERPGKTTLLVEFKSTNKIFNKHLKTLKIINESHKNSEAICVCTEERKRKQDNILICPWQEALEVLEL